MEIEGSRHELTKIYRRAKYYWVGIPSPEREREKGSIRDADTSYDSLPRFFGRLLALIYNAEWIIGRFLPLPTLLLLVDERDRD